MKKVALVIFTVMMLLVWIPGTAEYGYYGTDSYTDYAYMPATLNQRLATRTGPGTRYDGVLWSVLLLSAHQPGCSGRRQLRYIRICIRR